MILRGAPREERGKGAPVGPKTKTNRGNRILPTTGQKTSGDDK